MRLYNAQISDFLYDCQKLPMIAKKMSEISIHMGTKYYCEFIVIISNLLRLFDYKYLL